MAAGITVRTGVVLSALASLLLSCGDDDGAGKPSHDHRGDGGPGDAGVVSVASDPCLTTGYHFDGKSDCDVVRCPDLRCECTEPFAETISLHACVRGQGCVDRIDCSRACNANGRLDRMACQQRLTYAGAACKDDADCVTGHCRQESAGKLCVDMIGCGADGHCSAGFVCRFSPGSRDADTGVPSSLGSCADGSLDSVCYEDAQCKYHRCASNRCTGGAPNDACDSDGDRRCQFRTRRGVRVSLRWLNRLRPEIDERMTAAWPEERERIEAEHAQREAEHRARNTEAAEKWLAE